MNIVHAVNIAGTTQRHKRAQGSWSEIYAMGVVPIWMVEFERDSSSMGGKRKVPFLRDILTEGLRNTSVDDDIVVWCNDDVQLDPRIVGWLAGDVAKNGSMSMRRIEPGYEHEGHMGRELFAFTKKWLEQNLDKIPDFVIGSPCFDLVIAAMIRNQYGLKSTLQNMSEDFPLCEARERYAIHERHKSAWAGKNEYVLAENNHNRKLAKEWCAKYMPSLAL